MFYLLISINIIHDSGLCSRQEEGVGGGGGGGGGGGRGRGGGEGGFFIFKFL